MRDRAGFGNGPAWARVPLRGVSFTGSGGGGPGDSFEDLETSRIARIPRGLRCELWTRLRRSRRLFCHTLRFRPLAAGGPPGRLTGFLLALDWLWSLFLSRARSEQRPERNHSGYELVSRRNVWGTPRRRGGGAVERDGAAV